MGLFSGISKAVGKVASSITGGDLLGFAGSALGGFGSYMGASSANAATLASTEEQMKFQERMRSTQYQTAVDDMKKAGLNPMLAYSQGGSGTPAGSSYSAIDAGTPAVNSALASRRLAADVDKIKADTAASESVARLNEANAIKASYESQLTAANARAATVQAGEAETLRDVFGSYNLKGEMLTNDWLKSKYEQFVRSNDQNKINALNAFALQSGYGNNFLAAVDKAEFRNLLSENVLKSNMIPESQAMSDFYRSGFGKEVAPYLNSAKSMSDIANRGINLFRPRGRFEFRRK